MSWEPRPTPDVNPETAAFWAAASEGRFTVSRCGDCGLAFHYPRTRCPDCFSDRVELEDASGEGEIYSYSFTEQVGGWPEEALPLVLAYVELDEGPRVMTNVVGADPESLSVGQRVEVEFVDTEADDVSIPVFTPV